MLNYTKHCKQCYLPTAFFFLGVYFCRFVHCLGVYFCVALFIAWVFCVCIALFIAWVFCVCIALFIAWVFVFVLLCSLLGCLFLCCFVHCSGVYFVTYFIA